MTLRNREYVFEGDGTKVESDYFISKVVPLIKKGFGIIAKSAGYGYEASDNNGKDIISFNLSGASLGKKRVAVYFHAKNPFVKKADSWFVQLSVDDKYDYQNMATEKYAMNPRKDADAMMAAAEELLGDMV